MPRRDKPPISQWIVDERKRHGWKVDEVSRRLLEMGYEAQPSTVQVWEAGRTPRADTLEALERLFDSHAPREVDIDAARGEAIAVMTEAIRQQTQVMREMLLAMREERSRTYSSEDVLAMFDVLRAQGFLTIPDRVLTDSVPEQPTAATPAAPRRRASRATR